MERILIIGSPGSGKSTLAVKLSQKLDLPLVHLDRLYWRENWVHLSKEEFDDMLIEELKKPRWIIDGNFSRTIPLRLFYCDTVIYLDYSRMTCIRGVMQRVAKNYGKTRPDMGDGCPERFDPEFLRFVWGFRKKNRAHYMRLLNGLGSKIQVVVLKSRRQGERFLQGIEAGVKAEG